MKRFYFPPQCEMSDYEPKTFILANSVPQGTREGRSPNNAGTGKLPEWGNLW